MSFDVDPSFRNSGQRSRKRKTRRKARRALLALSGIAGIAILGLLGWVGAKAIGNRDTSAATVTANEDGSLQVADDGFAMVQTAGSAEAGILAARAVFIDIAKDPMILRFDSSGLEEGSRLEGPTALPAARVGFPRPDRLALLRDDLVLQETRLVTTIPSSREDLAYFQAQRSQGIAALSETGPQSSGPQVEAEAGDVVSVDGADGSWGELIGGSDGVTEDDTATYVETQIENTTSVAFLLRESERLPLYEDNIVVNQTARDLTEIITSAGIDEAGAGLAASAAARLIGIEGQVPAGAIVAMRVRPDVRGPQLVQMSYYLGEEYVGTLAQVGAGRFDTGADPWIDTDLLTLSDDVRPAATQQRDIRLLDALYSAAIRNGLSTTLVGELVVMMSQRHDLDRFAAVGDRVTILYATEPGSEGAGAGQILYAGVRGPSGTIDCYVVPDPVTEGYGCFAPGGGGAVGGIGGGLIIPVSGTKTSDFGPRMHPVLRQLRNHNGVDWAAPTGTPIHAAADGVISSKRVSDSYGNVIYIDHPGSRQTRYAHMDRFADGISQGSQVRAGDLIGYVGTTGRSTGPHLHFEFWLNGTPVDPLTAPGTGGRPGGGSSSDAVEALVNQIIAVESGGRADAANPNSTAVGLGQFIESTWIRMMNNYRPDLAQSMSRADLLALRTNPELSREMVTNLARENEAYLRSRGHTITPGRLYLSHFLGPAGANTALNAPPDAMVVDIMGEGVVRANGFLRGKTIADLWAWADRKMGNAPTVAIARARPVPPEVRAYMDLIEPIIEEG
ncbi:peptidoglycan DD-metalloendopeptidase family protein [Marivivens marinus]|uniref:peptidoglycan DD-metalloendopeptidase family protein n=1 Tax=Marivivens marinus TaxID=3110173 RepID=UPI003B84AADB